MVTEKSTHTHAGPNPHHQDGDTPKSAVHHKPLGFRIPAGCPIIAVGRELRSAVRHGSSDDPRE